MKTLAIITARGGSKRIPGKNIKKFCGKPILIYSIEAALESGAFDEVMVSTDDERIAEIAKNAGASVPFMRSDKTSGDHASTDEVIAEVLESYKKHGKEFERFCCIYPTAPFITAERLSECMKMLDEHESVTPVCRFSYPPQRGFVIEDGRLVRAYPEHALTRSQDLDKLFHDAGQFYACRSDAFFRDGTTDVADMVPLILGEDEVQDIDTPEDWKIAEDKFANLKGRSSILSSDVFDDNKLTTPYYRIDEALLDADIRMLKDALSDPDSGWTNHICSYSVKTNSLPWLLNHLKEEGFYAEVVSKEEYELAMHLGYEKDRIIFNGPVKDRETFERVLLDGGIVNMDSNQEPEWIEKLASHHPDRTFDVGLRVNYDLASILPEEKLADEEGGRFGYCYENGELLKAIDKLRSISNVKVSGLHMHSSTKTRTVDAYRGLAKVACKIAEEYGLDLDYVDMGGGYYGGVKDKPDFRDYIPAISDELKKCFDPLKTKLIVEPGISLVSSSFSFVTSVIDTKKIRDQVYVVTDASRMNLNPQVTRRSYPHFIRYTDDERDVISSQMVCGNTCMEYDRLFPLENEKELKRGDRIVYTNAGGYTICLTPLFIHYFPAVYVKKSDGSLFTARRPWNTQDFLRGNNW